MLYVLLINFSLQSHDQKVLWPDRKVLWQPGRYQKVLAVGRTEPFPDRQNKSPSFRLPYSNNNRKWPIKPWWPQWTLRSFLTTSTASFRNFPWRHSDASWRSSMACPCSSWSLSSLQSGSWSLSQQLLSSCFASSEYKLFIKHYAVKNMCNYSSPFIWKCISIIFLWLYRLQWRGICRFVASFNFVKFGHRLNNGVKTLVKSRSVDLLQDMSSVFSYQCKTWFRDGAI